MLCVVCERVAAGWCQGCGALYCSDHGGGRCFRCAGAFIGVEPECHPPAAPNAAIFTLDRQSHWSGKGYLQCLGPSALPTVYVDDPGPPACHECGGLAKKVCSNCHTLFCGDHAGTAVLCRSCLRSSRLGMAVLATVIVLLGLLMLLYQWH